MFRTDSAVRRHGTRVEQEWLAMAQLGDYCKKYNKNLHEAPIDIDIDRQMALRWHGKT